MDESLGNWTAGFTVGHGQDKGNEAVKEKYHNLAGHLRPRAGHSQCPRTSALLAEPLNLLSCPASEGLAWQAPWGLAAAPGTVLL